MKLFKTTDEKLSDIGFEKLSEDKFGCEYERIEHAELYRYRHKVVILHKKSGKHIIQSYDPDLMDDKNIGCTCVGLTRYEVKLFLKKMVEYEKEYCKRWTSR